MTEDSEYVDYDLYLDKSFDPVEFANSLVLATNNASDLDIDLDTPAKRLDYDLEEISKITATTISVNYKHLLQQAASNKLASDALVPLKTSLDHINSSYAKLQADILDTYSQAQIICSALKRVHATSGLLRALTWYLYLARQLSTVSSSSSLNDSNEPRALIQSAQTLLEVRRQLAVNPSIKSLRIIRQHEASLDDIEQSVKHHAKTTIKFFGSSSSKNRTQMTSACLALYLLDPQSLGMSISNILETNVTAAATQIVRALGGALSGLENALNDAVNRANSLNLLESILTSAQTRDIQADLSQSDSQSVLTIWEFIESSLDVTNLVSTFWRDVASNVEIRTRDFSIRNPAIVRSLQANSARIKEIIRTSIQTGGGISATGLESKVLINAIPGINR